MRAGVETDKMSTVEGSQFMWEGNHGISEASSLQVNAGVDLTSLNVSNVGNTTNKALVQFDLERREYRQGELVAWHFVSSDSNFSLTVFND